MSPDDVSAAALRRYAERQRRPRIVYAAVVSIVVVALAVVVVVAWTRGETNNTTSHTVAAAPANLPLSRPAVTQTERWSVAATAALGQPQWRGTVVVSDQHAMRGLDARTGKTTWSYSRSDRTVCAAAQLNGVAIAVYRLQGNCDEVTAVDAFTGQRRWTRTLDMDGMPLNGTPTFEVSNQGGYGTLLMSTSSVIYAIDPASGYNRWSYTRYGCRIDGVALGSAGALIEQNCSNAVLCDQQKFCKAGRQLLLRNAYTDHDNKDTKNPDKIIWNKFGADARPVSADSLVSALDSSGALVQFASSDGAVTVRRALTPEPDDSGEVDAVDAGGTEIVGIGTNTYAVRAGVGVPIWTRTGSAPATVLAVDAQQSPTLSTARITVPTASGVQTVDGTSGRTAITSSLGTVGPGRVYPLGGGFLVAGADSTTAFA